MTPACNARPRSEASRVRRSCGREHERSRAVVNSACVPGRDGTAILAEDRPETGEVVLRNVGPHMLVHLEASCARPALQLNGNDLLGEPAFLLGPGCASVTFGGERILLETRDAMPCRDIFRRHAHVTCAKGIVENGVHRIDHCFIAHAPAPPQRLHHVRRLAHAFDAASHREITLAERDHLCDRDDRLNARSAQPIERQRGRLVGNACRYRTDPRQVSVARLTLDDLPQHDMANVRGCDISTLNRLGKDGTAKLPRGNILEAASEITDRGADTG